MAAVANVSSSGVPTSSTTASYAGKVAKPVKGRRGTLYHLSSIVEEEQRGTTTLDDVKVRRRFATNRYFLSAAGVLKLLVVVSTVPPCPYRVVLHAEGKNCYVTSLFKLLANSL
jgi:hypothetical protein